MIIDRKYILDSMSQMIVERQAKALMSSSKRQKEFKIKQSFPKWMRKIIFHPYNPVYAVYMQSKAQKGKDDYSIPLSPLHPYVIDYLKYCTEIDLHFDTDLYFPKQDEEAIRNFIDYKIASFVPGGSPIPMNAKQRKKRIERAVFNSKIKKEGDFYRLNLDEYSYYLPKNKFEENVFAEEYGLMELPEKVREYMKGKDFLDVGAFYGDSAIFFLKYEPRKVYAYEPVSENIVQLAKTIKKSASDKIVTIEKGIGDKETTMAIAVDSEKPSSCSLADNVIDKTLPSEIIHITTIDKECVDKKVGLMKFDIEGFEYNAIQGGLETIKRDQPVLLISIYHTGKDFFEIPKVLKDLVPSYLFRFIDIDILNPLSEKIVIAYPNL